MPVICYCATLAPETIMSALAMSKKRPNPTGESRPKRVRDTAPIQVEKDLARKVGVICQHRNIKQWQLISPVIRNFVNAQYAIVSEEINREVKEGRPPDSD